MPGHDENNGNNQLCTFSLDLAHAMQIQLAALADQSARMTRMSSLERFKSMISRSSSSNSCECSLALCSCHFTTCAPHQWSLLSAYAKKKVQVSADSRSPFIAAPSLKPCAY